MYQLRTALTLLLIPIMKATLLAQGRRLIGQGLAIRVPLDQGLGQVLLLMEVRRLSVPLQSLEEYLQQLV